MRHDGSSCHSIFLDAWDPLKRHLSPSATDKATACWRHKAVPCLQPKWDSGAGAGCPGAEVVFGGRWPSKACSGCPYLPSSALFWAGKLTLYALFPFSCAKICSVLLCLTFFLLASCSILPFLSFPHIFSEFFLAFFLYLFSHFLIQG